MGEPLVVQMLCSITWCQDRISSWSIHCRVMGLQQWCLDWFCPTAWYGLRPVPVDGSIFIVKKWCTSWSQRVLVVVWLELLYITMTSSIDRSALTSIPLWLRTHFQDLCRSKGFFKHQLHATAQTPRHPLPQSLVSSDLDVGMDGSSLDTDFWHIWNSEWSPCTWRLCFWYVQLHLCIFMWYYLDP